MVIKVCGMREGHNIREVEVLRPTMMGFICWEGSSRNVEVLPSHMPRCLRVGVFVNPQLAYLQEKARMLSLDRVQLHGDETPQFCERVIETTGLPIIKAISVRTAEDIRKYRPYEGIADLLLFDTKHDNYGGSGEQFGWDIMQHYDGEMPFLLAGGIGPEDAAKVLRFRHPRFIGVDLNSRFETIPGHKHIPSLLKFINEIRLHEPHQRTFPK